MQSVVDWFVVVVCNNCWSPVEFVSSLVLMIQSVVLCLSVCLCVRRQPVSISHQLKLICLFQPRSWWYSTPIYRYLSVTANTCYWAMLLLLLPLLLLMMMMYAASAWEYIWIYVIMGPSFLEGGPIMYRCCPSVRLSVCPFVHLSVRLSRASNWGKTKRPTNTKLGRKGPRDTSTPWTNFKVKGSKVKITGHSSCVNLSLIIRIFRYWLVD